MIFPRKPRLRWERPDPLTVRGDSSPHDLFRAVGAALSAWEALEEELAVIFASLIQSDDPVPSMRAYGSIATSRGRNEMIIAAADAYFIEAPYNHLEKRFRAIMPALKGLAARRNDIAHGVVRQMDVDEYGLAPPAYMTSKVKWKTGFVYVFNAAIIESYATDFLTLTDHLSLLRFRLETFNFARKAYGGKLSPSQTVRLDRLLRFPTLRIPKAQP